MNRAHHFLNLVAGLTRCLSEFSKAQLSQRPPSKSTARHLDRMVPAPLRTSNSKHVVSNGHFRKDDKDLNLRVDDVWEMTIRPIKPNPYPNLLNVGGVYSQNIEGHCALGKISQSYVSLMTIRAWHSLRRNINQRARCVLRKLKNAKLGKNWIPEFEAVRVSQKYDCNFSKKYGIITGWATSELEGTRRDFALLEVKWKENKPHRVEVVDAQGRVPRIYYVGTFAGDEIPFHREAIQRRRHPDDRIQGLCTLV